MQSVIHNYFHYINLQLQKLFNILQWGLSDTKGIEEQKMKRFQQANLIVDVLIEAVH